MAEKKHNKQNTDKSTPVKGKTATPKSNSTKPVKPQSKKPVVKSKPVPQSKPSPKSTPEKSAGKKVPVRVNVYSLAIVNEQIKSTGFGVYHSGVECHGTEWAFGGHPYPVSGIYTMLKPRDLKSLSNIDGRFQFMEAIRIGHTEMTLQQIRGLLIQLSAKWRGNQYHLLYKNCNHFAHALCKKLCHHGLPDWINRVPRILKMFPFVIKLIPTDYLTPPVLEEQLNQTVKEQVEKDGTMAKSAVEEADEKSECECEDEKDAEPATKRTPHSGHTDYATAHLDFLSRTIKNENINEKAD